MFGFYQKCILEYSEIVKPLRHLIKAEKFVWDKIHENTFDKLKSAISDAANLNFLVENALILLQLIQVQMQLSHVCTKRLTV